MAKWKGAAFAALKAYLYLIGFFVAVLLGVLVLTSGFE
jgi:hypothetical protein